MQSNCIFCKIIRGETPTEIVYRDESLVAFKDLYPKAPHHLLIVPIKHIATLNELQGEEWSLIGRMSSVAHQLAMERKIAERGYRIVINCNTDGGQVIFHLHLHLLGGRKL